MNDKMKDEYNFEWTGDNYKLSSMVGQLWPVMRTGG
jgi:hypothetical protein